LTVRSLLLLAAMALLLIRPLTAAEAEREVAIVAGGCFWCVESDFDHVPGVSETVSGYTGGAVMNPTYQMVGRHNTGHREAVRITFNPKVISYEKLLSIFWRTVDPTDAGGQFCDRGEPYETAVFVANDAQRAIAERSKEEAAKSLGKSIVTPILPATTFWPAEDYHQDYHNKNAISYKFYRWRCGRDQRIEELWGDQAHMGLTKP
jgi:peptide-methionine (S)-S-oxide reductase